MTNQCPCNPLLTSCLTAVIVSIGWLIALPASAHTLKLSTTEIVWHPENRQMQVTHAIHLDDAMALMADLGSPEGEMTIALQARLMLYLEQRFSLVIGGKPLALEPIGAQLLGDFLWLYQEQDRVPVPHDLQVHIRLLQEYFPDQRHLINLSIGSNTRTLRLNAESPGGSFENFNR